MEKCLILSIVVGRYSLGSGSIKPDTLNMQDNPRGGGVRKVGLRESYKAVMHAAAGRRHAGIFSYAATPKPLKSAWRENLKNFKKKFEQKN